MAKDSFIFHRQWLDAINQLDEAEQLELYQAITNYALDGIELKVNSELGAIAIQFIKNHIDRDTAKYERRCKGGKR